VGHWAFSTVPCVFLDGLIIDELALGFLNRVMLCVPSFLDVVC